MHSNNLDNQNSYIIDEPIKTKDEDQLNRYPIAQRIVKTIAVRNDPSSLVIGLYGEWGEGKSTVLNFVDIFSPIHHKALLLDCRIVSDCYRFYNSLSNGITIKLIFIFSLNWLINNIGILII